MEEKNLTTNYKGATCVNSDGVETTEIDYFLYNKSSDFHSERLVNVGSSVSDHYPIKIDIDHDLNIKGPTTLILKFKSSQS